MPQSSTPDFDTYPVRHHVDRVELIGNGIKVHWDDGFRSSFQRFWLRENAPDPGTTHPVTKEQALELMSLPDDLQAERVQLDAQGSVAVHWSTGDTSTYHPGWLRAWSTEDYGALFELPSRQIWNTETLPEVPRFDGPRALSDSSYFGQWCEALHIWGVALLEGLPTTESTIETVPSMIGPIRTTNFGHLFDVRDQADATSNAYTNMSLPLHGDLCTREYMPGLQFLHCLQNSVDGGVSQLADGFAIAQRLQQEFPEDYATLTTQPMAFYNKALDTDYRYEKPCIGLDSGGNLDEIRLSPWLRAPLNAPIEEVERSYVALRRAFRLAGDTTQYLTVKLQPGELLGFDNRRVQHGRTGYDLNSGERWLRGCYVEREELHSRLRIIARLARNGKG